MKKLKEFQPVSPEDFVVYENGTAYSYFIDRGLARENAQEVEEFPKLYTAEQMQEYAKLEEKLDIAVDALTHIKFNGLFKKAGPHGDYAPYDVATQTELAEKSLAEIGGADE